MLFPGEGGLATICDRYSASFSLWWKDLGAPHLDSALAAQLVAGMGTPDTRALAVRRDALIIAMPKASAALRAGVPDAW